MASASTTTADALAAVAGPLISRGIVGISIGCIDATGALVSHAQGLADRRSDTPLTSGHLFRIASVTKTFVSAIILQLHHEGVVALEAPLARWLPDLPYADAVTLYQVMTHTGGLPTYSHYRLDDFPPADSSWSPTALIRRAYDLTPPGPPGGPFDYANVGSKVLGRVIELATGQSLGEEMQSRLLTPLSLADTVPSGAGLPLPARLARGYYHDVGEEGAPPQDATERVSPSFLWSGGDMYATAPDLARWTQALFGGAVLPPIVRERLFTDLVPGRFPGSCLSHHGLGVMVFERDGHRLYGYRGSTPGYVGIVGFDREHGIAVAIQTNSYAPIPASQYRAAVEPALFSVIALLRDAAEGG